MTTLLLALLCAFSVSFVWKPSPDPRMTNTPSGYIMVWGHSSGAYTSSTNVGNVTGLLPFTPELLSIEGHDAVVVVAVSLRTLTTSASVTAFHTSTPWRMAASPSSRTKLPSLSGHHLINLAPLG